MLFDGNPQLAVLDKQMVLRQVEKTESNLGRGNLVDFINSPDRLAALISELVAEPDPTPSQPRESANATEDDTGGSDLHEDRCKRQHHGRYVDGCTDRLSHVDTVWQE